MILPSSSTVHSLYNDTLSGFSDCTATGTTISHVPRFLHRHIVTSLYIVTWTTHIDQHTQRAYDTSGLLYMERQKAHGISTTIQVICHLPRYFDELSDTLLQKYCILDLYSLLNITFLPYFWSHQRTSEVKVPETAKYVWAFWRTPSPNGSGNMPPPSILPSQVFHRLQVLRWISLRSDEYARL